MYRIIQKLSATVALPLLFAVVVAPTIVPGTAAAATTTKTGMCLLETETVTQVNQTTQPNTVKKCTSFFPKNIDSNGKKLSKTGCYGVQEINSKFTLIGSLKCTDSRLTGK